MGRPPLPDVRPTSGHPNAPAEWRMGEPQHAPDPWTGDDIARALRRVHVDGRRYWEQFLPEAFLAPLGAAWSPADNVRHLTKAMRAVAVGLRMPRLLLWLRFGRARRPSRSYAALRETYLERLGAGGQAGRFAPGPTRPAPDAAAAQARILASHAAAVDQLVSLLARWPEDALDQYQLPHPLLGGLTVREMMFFTLYHNQHHVAVVRRRTTAAAAPSSDI